MAKRAKKGLFGTSWTLDDIADAVRGPDAMKRLDKGQCPIHGVGLVPYKEPVKGVAIFQCPRKDCGMPVQIGVNNPTFKLLMK
jgi:hypothetical protein